MTRQLCDSWNAMTVLGRRVVFALIVGTMAAAYAATVNLVPGVTVDTDSAFRSDVLQARVLFLINDNGDRVMLWCDADGELAARPLQ